MKKIMIFGNSGSGKSTLAKSLSLQYGLSHFDLDMIAWFPGSVPKRCPINDSKKKIIAFISKNEEWVIEGCYSDLIEIGVPYCNELIYMNLSVEKCVANAKRRPWEPHKYATKEAQDSNLEMLINWIEQYEERGDSLSKAAHDEIFRSFIGSKKMIKSNSNPD